MNKQRQSIINDAAKIVREITELFNDTEHWNSHAGVSYEEAINVDPDGKLLMVKSAMEAMLKREAELGNFPS